MGMSPKATGGHSLESATLFFDPSQYYVGKSWIAAAGLDSAGPHPLMPTPTRKDTRERAYPKRCCAMRTSGEMRLLYFCFMIAAVKQKSCTRCYGAIFPNNQFVIIYRILIENVILLEIQWAKKIMVVRIITNNNIRIRNNFFQMTCMLIIWSWEDCINHIITYSYEYII